MHDRCAGNTCRYGGKSGVGGTRRSKGLSRSPAPGMRPADHGPEDEAPQQSGALSWADGPHALDQRSSNFKSREKWWPSLQPPSSVTSSVRAVSELPVRPSHVPLRGTLHLLLLGFYFQQLTRVPQNPNARRAQGKRAGGAHSATFATVSACLSVPGALFHAGLQSLTPANKPLQRYASFWP